MAKDIRWIQRFYNYQKALRKLNIAIERLQAGTGENEESHLDEDLEEILKEGLIKRFEYTQELAWNVMKDYAEYQGNTSITGSRDSIREAFQMGLIVDAQAWMNMLRSRNLTSHTYNSETAEAIHDEITDSYVFLFNAFEEKMSQLMHGSKLDLFGKE
jgi:nucleotidyltransferase substrate binding protein (TIGR01987 family)